MYASKLNFFFLVLSTLPSTLADSPADPFVEDQRASYVLVAEAFAALHAGADEVARIPHRNTNETRPTSFWHGK